MRALFMEDTDIVDNDNDDADDDENGANLRLNSQFEYCSGIRIRQSLHLPSKVCERCCEFVRMWFSFRQMCLNSQVYLESTYLREDLMDASESEYIEHLYETLQLQTMKRCSTSEEEDLQSRESNELEADYVVQYYDDSFVADSVQAAADEDKHKLPEIISELETYEDDAENETHIEVEQTLIYADDCPTVDELSLVKEERCDDECDYSNDNDDFLSPTPSPDPKPSSTSKRKPGRPRKPDNELKAKRKTKGEQSLKVEPSATEGSATKYMCNLCGNVYPKKAAFTAHMMAHTDYKPHQCEICCKSFRQMGELRAHIRRHTGERPYKCLYCDRHFYDRSEKVRHERVHTNTRPYECKECGKTFTHTAILKNHSLVHSGEKNFNCSICSKSFTLLHQLKAHLQTLTHRSKEDQAFASSSSYNMP
ncbi:hypothetical protein ACLKA6_016446 [Drosophila palustris]